MRRRQVWIPPPRKVSALRRGERPFPLRGGRAPCPVQALWQAAFRSTRSFPPREPPLLPRKVVRFGDVEHDINIVIRKKLVHIVVELGDVIFFDSLLSALADKIADADDLLSRGTYS